MSGDCIPSFSTIQTVSHPLKPTLLLSNPFLFSLLSLQWHLLDSSQFLSAADESHSVLISLFFQISMLCCILLMYVATFFPIQALFWLLIKGFAICCLFLIVFQQMYVPGDCITFFSFNSNCLLSAKCHPVSPILILSYLHYPYNGTCQHHLSFCLQLMKATTLAESSIICILSDLSMLCNILQTYVIQVLLLYSLLITFLVSNKSLQSVNCF